MQIGQNTDQKKKKRKKRKGKRQPDLVGKREEAGT